MHECWQGLRAAVHLSTGLMIQKPHKGRVNARISHPLGGSVHHRMSGQNHQEAPAMINLGSFLPQQCCLNRELDTGNTTQ